MKISIVTPSYNQGQFIEDAIQSVLKQNYPNFEHIIIDNCSTDNTIEILKKYPHLKWISEPDNGQSDGLNKGFQRAEADWILWLNADDFLLPDALEIFANSINRHESADLFYGHVRFVDEHKKLIKTVYHIPYSYFLTLFGVYMPPSTGSLFRASLLKQNALSEEYHFTMDTEWFLRCGKKLKPILIDHVISAFRVSSTNKTAQHIIANIVLPQHKEEQKRYQEKYVLPRLPSMPRKAQEVVYSIGHRMCLIVRYSKKLRYVGCYLRQYLSGNRH